MEADLTRGVLMYFVLPLWLAAGFADWLCHRAARIAVTAGPKESLLHLLMFGEMAIPIIAAMALEINALVFLVMIICFFLHEATALWDVSYAVSKREVSPIEQHVHSFLEILPLMGLTLIAVLNWPQFLSLFGLGAQKARFELAWKEPELPWTYVVPVLSAVLLFEVIPYAEELIRGLRAKGAHVLSGTDTRKGLSKDV
jgi:hypothetical protein